MLSDDLLAGAQAAARYLGLTTKTVYAMAEDGRLPVTRIGRRLYFRRSELDRTFSASSSNA